MLKLFVLAAAGGIGTLGRYWLTGALHRFAGSRFPYGTLAVNILGCLLIGFVVHLVRDNTFVKPEARTLLTVGLLGGFTTFSAFGLETLELVQAGSVAEAALNVLGNVVVGIAAVWLGMEAGRLV